MSDILKSIVGKTLAVLVFITLVLMAVAIPRHQEPSIYTMAPTDVDQKIGNSTFKIGRCGDATCMEPLLAPSFRMQLLKGDGIQANMITRCTVYNRTTAIDEKAGRIYSLTVLKCDGNEYGISEVDFRFDGERK
jgi:hypothetical protein